MNDGGALYRVFFFFSSYFVSFTLTRLIAVTVMCRKCEEKNK